MEIIDSEQNDYLIKKNIIMRNYQNVIINIAKNRNSIVFLPTGTGKTLIAIHVLCSKTSQITGTFPEKAKRAFFLAPTKTLVFQLHKIISIHTKFKVGLFTGDLQLDLWSKENWEEQFKNYQVLVMTGEILKQIIELKFILPSQISLIVFDECHHAVMNHPYRIVLQHTTQNPSPTSPLVLGLSAVLLNTNPKKKDVLRIIRSIKNIFNGVILTAQQLNETKRFAAKPEEKLVTYESSDSIEEDFIPLYDEVINVLKDLILIPPGKPTPPKASKLYTNPNRARRLKNWFENAKDTLKECGLYCGALVVLYYIILVEKTRLMTTDPDEIQTLVYCRTALYKIRHILLNVVGEETVENIFKYSSNKVKTLLNLLKSISAEADKKYASTLIFVQQKAAAVTLATLLKKLKNLDNSFSFLKPEFIFGSSLFDKETLLHEYKNEEIMKEFSSQNLNTLVSTNILEEGIDIISCNAVISFHFPKSYASYFQTRGRARDKEGYYYLFVKEDELGQKNQILNEYRQIEQELYKVIKNDCDKLDMEEDLSPEGEGEISSLAIKSVYRYCSKLPQDKYSFLSPTAWYTQLMEGKKASVQLPINCPLQDIIEGEVMATAKLAKKSAFLETLRRLKEMGEIDENNNPVTYNAKTHNFSYLFPHFKKEEIQKDGPFPGTKKRRQTYEVKFAQSLSECLPQPGLKAYLHVINFDIKFEKFEREDKLSLQEVLLSPVTFAILSSKKLFKVCQFPMFLDLGQIGCDLLINHDEVVLSKSELKDIKLCHFAVFQKVLKITKNFQIFDNRNKGHSFYIVPVKKNEYDQFVLDWDIIRCDFCRENKTAVVRYNPSQSRNVKGNIQGLRRETLPSSSDMVPLNVLDEQDFWRSNIYEESNQGPQFMMSEADYKYFVISPNYRNIHPPQTYIVYKFRNDLSPLSPFPNSVYLNYCAYYQEKYMIQITNLKQPLLKVAFLFTCSNFNKPKFRNQDKLRWGFKNNDELLVPELCDILAFDRRYWVKALLLPTALNRIYHLYCLEEFRRRIINETGLGIVDFPNAAEWKALNVDPHLNENESNVEKISEPLNKALPLSQLKLKGKPEMNIVELKRNILEIGVCDLEYFVSFSGNIKSEEKLIESLFVLPDVDNMIFKPMTAGEISVPALKALKKRKNELGPDLADLVEAFTASSANDIISYERLEVLGDTFLKFAVTLFLFKNVNDNEGVLTFIKGKLVGNRNLLYCGLAKGFQDVLNVIDFAPLSDWNPPLTCLPEKLVDALMSNSADPAVMYRWDIPSDEQFSGILSNETLSKNEEITRNYDKACDSLRNSLLPYKSISDKTISDSVEALLGLYLSKFDLSGGFEILKWLDILPKSLGSYSQFTGQPYSPKVFQGSNLASVMNILSEVLYLDLEETLGYQFKNKVLLLEAITHPSFTRNRATYCYQRLEFLGDAILDFLITCYLYEHCGNLTPGQLTDIRSSLVNNITFASLSVRYGFHKYLLKLNSRLNRSIEEFVTHQASRNHVVDDNVLILLEENDCLIAEAVQVPKSLGDIFESLAGAIYLDSGYSLETVWAVFYRLMKNEIDTFTKSIPKGPVRLLHEICETAPYFEVAQIERTTRVACTVWYDNAEIKVYGFGANQKEAKRSAAKLAVKKISELKK